jgi:hypothetical protein
MQLIDPKQHPRIWIGFVAICEEYGGDLDIPPEVELWGEPPRHDLEAIEKSLAGLTSNQIEGLAVKQGPNKDFEAFLLTHRELLPADALFDELSMEWL